MKNKFIMAILFSAFLLVSPNVKAANFMDKQTVDANKAWTIKFNSDVGLDDDTKQGITVTNNKGKPVSVDIELGQDSKTITVTAPQGGYTPGESYILNVGSKAHSKNGKALKNEYKINFNIKNDTTNSNIVTFKDKQLEKVIRGKIKKPDGDIYKSDVEKITELDSYDFLTDWDRYNEDFIKDISGIEELKNLRELRLGGNLISDISPLKELTNLQVLSLHGNQNIKDLSPLSGLIELRFLDLNTDSISDISPLIGLTNLQYLDLADNWIEDINGIERLVNLQQIYLSGNNISSDEIKAFRNAVPNCHM